MTEAESQAARPRRLGEALLTAAVVALFLGMVGLVLSAAGDTRGYDYTCYAGAARHLLDGRPIYDNSFSIAVGTCPATYTYPPPFAVALVPWLVFGGVATWLWCVAMAACFLAGVALLPVRRDVRWLVVIVAAFDWPLLYAVKLGQVEPILFLGFAAAWRWIDRAWVVGAVTAVGALIKVQPALLAVWSLATRRYRAAAAAAVLSVALAAAATLVTGLEAWGTYADLLRGLNGSLATAHNFAPGAIAHQAGASDAVASAVQLGSVAAAAAALVAAWRWTSAEASLQVTILASQLLSSPLRDHYAVLLLLPTAWLLARGRQWAVAFPLVGWIALFSDGGSGSWPAAASVPVAFFVCLAVVLWEGFLARRAESSTAASGPQDVTAGVAREGATFK
jgi:hypothetical protein